MVMIALPGGMTMKKFSILVAIMFFAGIGFCEIDPKLYEKMSDEYCIADVENCLIWGLKDQAAEILEIVAKRGNPDAIRLLETYYADYRMDFQDEIITDKHSIDDAVNCFIWGLNDKAAEILELLAKRENVHAMRLLGIYYIEYISDSKTEQDLKQKEGFHWLSKAAEKGDPVAMSQLGYCYLFGLQTDIDTKKGFELYKKAANLGYNSAEEYLLLNYMNIVNDGTEEITNDIFQLIQKKADEGNLKALTTLGYMYYLGRGVQEDKKKAVNIYKKLVEQKYSFGYTNLAVCYIKGDGVEKNYKKAESLLKQVTEGKISDPPYYMSNDIGHAFYLLQLLYSDNQYGMLDSEQARYCSEMAKRHGWY